MGQYMLILHDNPQDMSDASPQELQSVVGEYMAWREKVASQDKLVGGNKLADEGGRLLTNDGGKMRVVDGPFAEAKEIVGGYFLVSAANYDEAVELCRDCPHLKYGSKIEVREIHEIHG